ncbi:hypothetical protein FS749_007285 [Ceratobasidium sp. UAMH 11750]|nr:hypothetical protein FS749_007285 [Ceratobasidium sp. UAMH 11750]
MDGPFYHEFLLLKLTDGAVCRIERTGDGSRADAIRYSGCTANDLIQWFSAEDYTRFSATTPSELVAEIEFGRHFDIMDVLAVCYSIQKVKASRVYTLQRYNCYFFCWIILAVLTRRITSWETIIRSRAWDSQLQSVMRHLSRLPAEDSRNYLLLRTCVLLDPNSRHPTAPLLDPLRTRLSSKAGALSKLNEAISATLWATSFESALKVGLEDAVTAAGKDLLADRGICGTQLRHAMRPIPRMTEQESHVLTNLAKSVYLAEASNLFAKLSRDLSHQFRRMEAERPVPLLRSTFYSLMACGESLAFVVGRNPRYLKRGPSTLLEPTLIP